MSGHGIQLRGRPEVEIAELFAKLRYGAESDFSLMVKPTECALILRALDDEFVEDLARKAARADALEALLARADSWLVRDDGVTLRLEPEDAAALAELLPERAEGPR